MRKLDDIDFRPFEARTLERAVLDLSIGPARATIDATSEAIRLLGTLGWLSDPGDDSTLAMELAHFDSSAVTSTVVTGGINRRASRTRRLEGATDGDPVPAGGRFCEEVDIELDRLGDGQLVSAGHVRFFCDVLSAELEQSRERLRQARGDCSKWGMISEGEEARRKSVQALRAGLVMAFNAVISVTPTEIFSKDPSELRRALAVRELLRDYSHDILLIGTEPEEEEWHLTELEEILRALRIRTIDLVLNPAYRDLRGFDRRNIQELNQSIITWLSAIDRDFDRARTIISGMCGLAVALRGIERRQILVEHDAKT